MVDPGLSLRPHIYNIITKTTRWEVVKNRASPKRPFFFFSKANFLDAQKGEGMCMLWHVPEMSPLDFY